MKPSSHYIVTSEMFVAYDLDEPLQNIKDGSPMYLSTFINPGENIIVIDLLETDPGFIDADLPIVQIMTSLGVLYTINREILSNATPVETF